MKPSKGLPISAEQSRAARFQLGMTQSNVIKDSGLPAHKLKQFETGRFIPDAAFLQKLREFYEGNGVDLNAAPDTSPAAPTVAPRPGAGIVAPVLASRFLVDPKLTQDQVDSILERMDSNDQAITGLMAKEAGSFFGDPDPETDAAVRQLFGMMGENYLLFRALQGRGLLSGGVNNGDRRTVADVVQRVYADSPVSGIASETKQASAAVDPPIAPAAPDPAEVSQ